MSLLLVVLAGYLSRCTTREVNCVQSDWKVAYRTVWPDLQRHLRSCQIRVVHLKLCGVFSYGRDVYRTDPVQIGSSSWMASAYHSRCIAMSVSVVVAIAAHTTRLDSRSERRCMFWIMQPHLNCWSFAWMTTLQPKSVTIRLEHLPEILHRVGSMQRSCMSTLITSFAGRSVFITFPYCPKQRLSCF